MFAVFLMRGTGFICTSTERDRCPRNGTFKNLMIITQKQMVHFILLYVFIGETNVANILPYEVPVTLQTTCIDTSKASKEQHNFDHSAKALTNVTKCGILNWSCIATCLS